MNRACWASALAGLLATLPAGATTPAAFYIGQSLLWQDRATGEAGELSLNADGRYAVFYHSLRVSGRFAWEGREGAYQATVAPGGVQLCLRPDGDAVPRGIGGLFHDAGCVTLAIHPIGEMFVLEVAGHSYRMALAQGR